MEIPVELQAFVLTKLDGVSLARAKTVCSLWKEAITKLEIFGNIWMRCCMKEMTPEILYQLSGMQELSDINSTIDHKLSEIAKSLPWTFWRDLYARFHRASYVKRCCSWQFKSIVQSSVNNEMATCLKLYGSSLLLGYRNGHVSLCEHIDQTYPQFSPLHHHGRHVTGLALVTARNKESSPVLISVSGGHDIQVISVDAQHQCQLNYHSKPVSCASAWNNRFVTGSGDTMLHGQPVWCLERPGCVIKELVLREHLSGKVTCTAMWADKVASGDDKGNVLLWDIHYPDEPTHLGCFNSSIRWIELRGALLLWLTASGILYTSTNIKSCKSLNVFQSLQRKPEALSLRGTLFAIGTKSGFVHLYHVSSLMDWNELDLKNADSVIKVDAEHINALDIGDDGNGPIVAVATETEVILVQWQTFHSK